MLLKDWGTSNPNKRLAIATQDLFDQAIELMNLGNPHPALPTANWATNVSLTDPTDGSKQKNVDLLVFRAYLADPRVNYSKIADHGNLRRFRMTSTEKMLHNKNAAYRTHGGEGHQHEMFICDDCISLQFSGLHVGFHIKSEDSSIYYFGSAVLPGTINYSVKFQLDVVVEKSHESEQFECLFQYKANRLELRVHPTDINIRGSKAVFIGDELYEELIGGLNSTILDDLDLRINNAVQYVARKTDLCTNFLTNGIFGPSTVGTKRARNLHGP